MGLDDAPLSQESKLQNRLGYCNAGRASKPPIVGPSIMPILLAMTMKIVTKAEVDV